MTITELDDGTFTKEVAGWTWTFTAVDYDKALMLNEEVLRNAALAKAPALFKNYAFTLRFKEAELAAVIAGVGTPLDDDEGPSPEWEERWHGDVGSGADSLQDATSGAVRVPDPALMFAGTIVNGAVVVTYIAHPILETMTGNELRDLARRYGLKTSYTKPTLIAMIQAHEGR